MSGILIAARDSVAPFTTAQVHLLEALAALVVVVAEHRIATGSFFTHGPAGLSATGSISGAGATAPADAGSSGPAGGGGDVVAMVVGMLRARLDIDEPQAVARLRAYAFTAGETIHEVARAVLARRISVEDLTAAP